MAETLLNIAYYVGGVTLVCFAIVLCVLTALLIKAVIRDWRDWKDV